MADPMPSAGASAPTAPLMSRDAPLDKPASFKDSKFYRGGGGGGRRSATAGAPEDDDFLNRISMSALLQPDTSDPSAEPLKSCWCCAQCPLTCVCDGKPNMKLKCLACLTDCLAYKYGMYDPAGTFNRAGWEKFMAAHAKKPGLYAELGVLSTDIAVPGTHGFDVPCRVFTPPGATRASPIIVFFHGGGFCVGHPQDAAYHDLGNRLAHRMRMTVVSVDYRLAPEHPFPAAWLDCHDVLRWIASCSGNSGGNGGVQNSPVGDARRLIVMGDSAGGSLAMTMASLARDGLDANLLPCAVQINIVHMVLIYPALFMPVLARNKNIFNNNAPRPSLENLFLSQASRNFYLIKTFGSFQNLEALHRSDRRVAPLLAKTDNLPPATVVAAEYDTLSYENRFLAHMLKKASVPTTFHMVNTVPHGFFVR